MIPSHHKKTVNAHAVLFPPLYPANKFCKLLLYEIQKQTHWPKDLVHSLSWPLVAIVTVVNPLLSG